MSTPPCGISISHANLGNNSLDFGFQVTDRFVMLTAVNTPGNKNTVGAQVCDFRTCPFLASTNQVGVQTFYTPGKQPAIFPT